jgi:uncharacterized membrane protein
MNHSNALLMTDLHTSKNVNRTIQNKWIVWFGIVYGIFITLPFIAPVFMDIGWKAAGNGLYFIYSFLCHQLPERSYFLFGSKFTYSLSEIQSAWQNTLNPMILRQFTGEPQMGWKVAWSDRMVSMYSSIWFFGLLWYPFRRRLPRLPFWGLVLFLLPMALDGTTHLISDFAGIGQGFRDSNLWLAALTHNALPPTFYIGDAWGSFNSILRLLTGVFFGIGMVWFGFPYLDEAFKIRAQPNHNFSHPFDNNLTKVGGVMPVGTSIKNQKRASSSYGAFLILISE